MTLSVLKLGANLNSYCLYDCDSEKMIMRGTEGEMYSFKDGIETLEKQLENETEIRFLRNKYMKLLEAGGNTPEEAKEFLTQRMPQLFHDESK